MYTLATNAGFPNWIFEDNIVTDESRTHLYSWQGIIMWGDLQTVETILIPELINRVSILNGHNYDRSQLFRAVWIVGVTKDHCQAGGFQLEEGAVDGEGGLGELPPSFKFVYSNYKLKSLIGDWPSVIAIPDRYLPLIN